MTSSWGQSKLVTFDLYGDTYSVQSSNLHETWHMIFRPQQLFQNHLVVTAMMILIAICLKCIVASSRVCYKVCWEMGLLPVWRLSHQNVLVVLAKRFWISRSCWMHMCVMVLRSPGQRLEKIRQNLWQERPYKGFWSNPTWRKIQYGGKWCHRMYWTRLCPRVQKIPLLWKMA